MDLKYRTHDEAYDFLVQIGATEKGIFEPEQISVFAAEIVETIPTAVKPGYAPEGLADDNMIVAANYYEFYKSYGQGDNKPATANLGGVVDTNTGSSKIKTKTVAPSLEMSDAQAAAVAAALEDQLAAKTSVAKQTKVKNLLVRAPKMSELLKGIKVTPHLKDMTMVDKYRKALVEDDENKANFEKVIAALDKLPLDPYINDKSRKYVGCTISTPQASAGKTETKDIIMNDRDLRDFLSFDVPCRIPTYEIVPGIKLGCCLRGWDSKNKSDKASTEAQAKPKIKWFGRQDAFGFIDNGQDNNAFVVPTTEITKEKQPKQVKVAVSFKVYVFQIENGVEVQKRDTKNKPIVKTIRLTGEAQVPVLKRTNKTFIEKFGVEEDKKTLSAELSEEDRRKVIELQTQLVDLKMRSKDGKAKDALADLIALAEGAESNKAAKTESFVD